MILRGMSLLLWSHRIKDEETDDVRSAGDPVWITAGLGIARQTLNPKILANGGPGRDDRGVLPYATATHRLRQHCRPGRSWCRSGEARCSAAFSSPAQYSQRWRRWCLCGTARRRPPCPALPSPPQRTTCWVSIGLPRDDRPHLCTHMARGWRK